MKAFYHLSLKEFLEYAKDDSNAIVEEIRLGALVQNVKVGDREIASWSANVKALYKLFSQRTDWNDDVVIAFEVKLPITGRVDCVIFGKDNKDCNNLIHIELKQWSNKNVKRYYEKDDLDTLVIEGGANRLSAHPIAQVAGYQAHLENNLPIFENKDYKSIGIAYCYNYDTNADEILTTRNECFKLYGKTQSKEFCDRIHELTAAGGGMSIMTEIFNSSAKPTHKLAEAAASMFDMDMKGVFTLIGNQLDAFVAIVSQIEKTKSKEDNSKSVFIIKGGPGTGKSVIALRLVSELTKRGFEKVFYATRAKALRNALQESLTNTCARDLIQRNLEFRPYKYTENGVDVLIIDEAHRITNSANDMNDEKKYKTYLPQTLSLIYTAKVSVFFIDDSQGVKPGEIGNSKIIKDFANNYSEMLIKERSRFEKEGRKLPGKIKKQEEKLSKCKKTGDAKKIHDAQKDLKSLKGDMEWASNWLEKVKTGENMKVDVFEYELSEQFRCNGSTEYQTWVDNLFIDRSEREDSVGFNHKDYDFEVFDSPFDLYKAIREKDDYARYADDFVAQNKDKFSYELLKKHIIDSGREFPTRARLVAGYCWKWDDKKIQANGDLLHEVIIDKSYFDGESDFQMPWETQAHPKKDFRFKYAKDADSWCSQNEGVNQVGCIFSVQGFETDYIGVIIGPDLRYDEKTDTLIAVPGMTHGISNIKKQESCNTYIRNIYRVLMTRGMKGCYVFACDPEVRKYLKRMLG